MSERKPQYQGRVLTAPQERALFHKHLTGDFPLQCRSMTIRALMRAGMVVRESQHGLVVTAQGKAYCEAHLRDLRPFLDLLT